MNKELVTIHIVANAAEELDYDPSRDGKTRSTGTKINVLRVSDGFSIVFDDDEFIKTDVTKLAASIVTLCISNVPDTIFDYRIMYHYDEDSFNTDVAERILSMDDLFGRLNDAKEYPTVSYSQTDNVQWVYAEYIDSLPDDDDDDEDDEDDEPEYEDSITALLKNNGSINKKKKKKKSRDYYGRSRVWKNSKQPKRQINRHGVLIAADKDDLKKDEKIIKSFLKDFLPGNSKWKKDFRDDVLDRWMRMYAISKKNLKQLEKEHRRSRTKKSGNNDKILKYANRLFTVPVDAWNNPNK